MPIHEYSCKNCGHAFTVFDHITTCVPDICACPKCDYTSAALQISAFHTDKDFGVPIRCIHRPLHSREDTEKLLTNCPDVSVEKDPDGDYVPVLRNQAAKRQLYKYLGLAESR
jgi:putative FmdB family regulatory protein